MAQRRNNSIDLACHQRREQSVWLALEPIEACIWMGAKKRIEYPGSVS